jgi:hypothetical protein
LPAFGPLQHVGANAHKPRREGFAIMLKNLIKYRHFKFDEKLRRIRFDFGQKRRYIANDSFRPVC